MLSRETEHQRPFCRIRQGWESLQSVAASRFEFVYLAKQPKGFDTGQVPDLRAGPGGHLLRGSGVIYAKLACVAACGLGCLRAGILVASLTCSW